MMVNLLRCACLMLAIGVSTASGQQYRAASFEFSLQTITDALEIPWAMAFLPGGEMLVTERSGQLRLIVDDTLQPAAVGGVPDVVARGQGGLLDVALHPDYAQNGWIYLSYSAAAGAGETGRGSNTALMRARLSGNQLIDSELLFKALPNYSSGVHFGGRIAFDSRNHVYLSIGDRGGRDDTQRLDNYRGKVIRLHDDGRIPADNPFLDDNQSHPEIWSWGHRNPQGLAVHPGSGQLWSHEHGPRGGDELNRIFEAANYGWPLVTFGVNYNGSTITEQTTLAGMTAPVNYWVPSIAPSDMTFVSSPRYPGWQTSILMGSLKFSRLVRVALTDNKVTEQEDLLAGIGRVRSVAQSPDGFIYIGVERPGRILKIVPK